MYQNGKYTFKVFYSNKDVLITVNATSEADGKNQVSSMLSAQGVYPSSNDLVSYEDTSKTINFTQPVINSTPQYSNYTGQGAEAWLQTINSNLTSIYTILKEMRDNAKKATF